MNPRRYSADESNVAEMYVSLGASFCKRFEGVGPPREVITERQPITPDRPRGSEYVHFIEHVFCFLIW